MSAKSVKSATSRSSQRTSSSRRTTASDFLRRKQELLNQGKIADLLAEKRKVEVAARRQEIDDEADTEAAGAAREAKRRAEQRRLAVEARQKELDEEIERVSREATISEID